MADVEHGRARYDEDGSAVSSANTPNLSIGRPCAGRRRSRLGVCWAGDPGFGVAATESRQASDQRKRAFGASTHQQTPVGAVVAAVMTEIEWMGRHRRPGLAAAAVALAEILDNPKAVSSQPAAAKVLSALLGKLRSVSAGGHRGRLTVVRAMSAGDDTQHP